MRNLILLLFILMLSANCFASLRCGALDSDKPECIQADMLSKLNSLDLKLNNLESKLDEINIKLNSIQSSIHNECGRN